MSPLQRLAVEQRAGAAGGIGKVKKAFLVAIDPGVDARDLLFRQHHPAGRNAANEHAPADARHLLLPRVFDQQKWHSRLSRYRKIPRSTRQAGS